MLIILPISIDIKLKHGILLVYQWHALNYLLILIQGRKIVMKNNTLDPENNINTMVLTYGFTFGFSSLDRLLIAMLFPFILPYFHFSLTQGGTLITCMAIGYIIFSVLGGAISDKYGRKKVIMPSLIIFSLGSALTGMANSFASLVGVRTVIGAAEGSYNAAAAAQISEEAPVEQRGKYMGIYQSFFALLGSFIAPIYAMNVAAVWGWQWACYLTIIPGIILAIIAQKFVKEQPRFHEIQAGSKTDIEKPKVSLKEILKEKNVVVTIILAMFAMTWLWSWLSFGTSYFVMVKKLSETASGGLMSAMGLGGFFGMMIVPSLSDKLGRKKMVSIGAIIGLLGTLVIVFMPNLGFIANYIAFFVTAFGAWGIFPIFLLVTNTESVPAEQAASAVGLVASIGEIVGIAIAPTLLGAIGDSFGLTATMLVGGAALIIVILISLFLRETAPAILNKKIDQAA